MFNVMFPSLLRSSIAWLLATLAFGLLLESVPSAAANSRHCLLQQESSRASKHATGKKLVTWELSAASWQSPRPNTSALQQASRELEQGTPKALADVRLVIGYGCAVGLLVIYFIWETGPMHMSRGIESTYLVGVMLLVYFTSVIWSDFNESLEDHKTVHKVRHLMFLILILHIFSHDVLPNLHPAFYENAPARHPVKCWTPKPTPVCKRKAEQLQAAVLDSLDLTSWRQATTLFANTTVERLLFLLFMVEDILWASHSLSKVAYWPLVAVTVIIPLCGVYRVVRRGRALISHNVAIHKRLADLIASQDQNVIQHVLSNVSVGTLVEVAKWQTVQEFIERTLEEGLLSTASKAILIDALQLRGLSYGREVQLAVQRIMLSCKGTELTTLKNLIDGSGSYRNLFKLVYEDVTSKVRQEILQHFAKEAQDVRQQFGLSVGVKVLSDLDDTLYSSGGVFPAGSDRRYPQQMVYPGCLSLLRALDRDWSSDSPSCNVVFISARPHLYKDVSEDWSFQLFRNLSSDGRLHNFPTLLPGGLWQGLFATLTSWFLKSRAWQPVGELKYHTYLRFRELYREYDFVLCGDNGQGDLFAGQRILYDQLDESESRRSGPEMLCVLIHRVVPEEDSLACYPGKHDEPLIIHSSYVGAAVALHTLDPTLISAEQVANVAGSAIEEFDEARRQYFDWEPARWRTAEACLRADLDKAAEILQTADLPPLRALITSEELLAEAPELPWRQKSHRG